MFFKHFIITLVFLITLKTCRADTSKNAVNAMPVPFAPPSPPTASKCNNRTAAVESQSALTLQFRLPFIDMEVQNEHSLHVLQETSAHLLYVLHGNELYQLLVSGAEKRLALVALLAVSGAQLDSRAAKVILWRKQYLLLAVASEEYIQIYQMPLAQLEKNLELARAGRARRDSTPTYEPIQQLTLGGRYRKMFLVGLEQNNVMLITAVNYTKLNAKLRTFEWSNTYFDLIEDLTVPAIHLLNVIGKDQKYLINGRLIRHQDKTIITVHEITKSDFRLHTRQTLTIPSRLVHSYTFRDKNYLFACTITGQQTKCNTFRMTDGQFGLYRQLPGKEFKFERLVAGTHFLAGTRQRDVLIYPNVRMNCFGSFTTNQIEVSKLMVHENKIGEVYVILTYRRPFNMLLRIAEVTAADGQVLGQTVYQPTDDEDESALHQHRHMFQDIVNQLRSLLLRRREAMDVFRNVVRFMQPKLSKLKINHPFHVESGNIDTVRVQGEHLLSPLQLLKRAEEIRTQYQRTRFVRSFDAAPAGITLQMPLNIIVQRLEVDNLIYNGSIIEGFHVENRSTETLPILSIRTPISTRTLNTTQLLTRQNYRQMRQLDEAKSSSGLSNVLRVRDLTVQRINNVSVAELIQSLFLRNRDRQIQGRLILQSAAEVEQLHTPLLNNFVVSQLFNLKQPQLVSSNLLINGISLRELQAEKMNGLNFAEDIAFSGQNDIIESPVELQHMNVAGDLILAYNPKQGGNIEDALNGQFQQFYTGKVIINGTLTITNLVPDNIAKTVFEVNEQPFSAAKLRENYFLQNTPQIIHTPVIFGNAKVTTPTFTTAFLNDHPTAQHLLNKNETAALERPLQLIFTNATIQGDLICMPMCKSKLCALSNDVVRHGEAANITGEKTFVAPLNTAHLMTLQLDALPADELVLKSQLAHDFRFYGRKSFDKLMVTGKAYIDKKLNCSFVNDLPLNELLQYNYHLKQLELPHELETSNIVFHRINGLPFDEVFSKFNVHGDKLMLHKDLLIDGDVRFAENLQVDTINDINWRQYEESLVRLGENAVISGPKRLSNAVTINKELLTPTINGVDLQEIFAKVLSKTQPQRITGKYSFNALRASNLDVPWINEVPTRTFMDTRAKQLVIAGDLVVPKLTVHGNLTGSFIHPFEFDKLKERLRGLVENAPWRNIMVHGNAQWNSTTDEDPAQSAQLKYLYRNAVRRSDDQVITGNVRLRQPLISKMQTKSSFPHDVDLDHIARDCLLRNTTVPQTLQASKSFWYPVKFRNVAALKGVQVFNLNDINVLHFNASLYRSSSGVQIMGPLFFMLPPIVGQLQVQGWVNGVNPAQLFHGTRMLAPPLRLHKLVVRNALDLQQINDMSLDFMLQNRVTLHGPSLQVFGHLTFEHLVLDKRILLQSINGIPIDKLVFTKSDDLQTLDGHKAIMGELQLLGPATVFRLNEQNLLDMRKQSMLITSNYQLNNLTLHAGTFVRGLILNTPPSVLARARAKIKEASGATSKQHQQSSTLQEAYNQLAQIAPTLNTSARPQSEQLLYLDFDFDMEVLKHPPNESVDKAFLYDLQHVSMCEHRLLQVQQAQLNKRVFLTNITTNFITAHFGHFNVKAQNYCQQRYQKVRSKITVSGRNITKVFGMKKYIEHIEILAFNESCALLLLHAVDASSQGRNEIRILKIDDASQQLNDWQSFTTGVGKSIRLFRFDNYTALLSTGMSNSQPVVSVYHFNPSLLQFSLAQTINGDFDLMELVAVKPLAPSRYQLILSCRSCQRIHFYEYVPEAESSVPYQSFQLIKLQSNVGQLHSFRLQDGNLYLLVLAARNKDFYYLYRYSFVQGWLQSAHGYFQKTNLAVPVRGKILESSGHHLLMLLCGGAADRCTLVKAFVH